MRRSFAVLAAAVIITVPLAATVPPTAPARHDAMAEAARALLDALDSEQRERAQLEIDDPNRLDWHYVPRPRQGLPLGDMTTEQREAAHGLLRAGLSSRGYLKVHGVIEIEALLYELAQERGRRAEFRDPGNYYFTVFGKPGDGPWGWRIEGHHVSINFSSLHGELIAATPFFLGADPATVRHGHRAGLRVLGAETDLAWELLRSLSDEQRSEAIIADRAPRDIILAPGAPADRLGDPTGLAFQDMTNDQRTLTRRLLHEYVHNLHDDLAAQQLARLEASGFDGLRFAWAGGTEPGRPHYWRLHAALFAIEYDNTQDGANHIHTVWHDLERNFGGDPLREHLEHDHE